MHSNLSPPEFEKLLFELLPRMGFSEVQLTGRSGDGGIDLAATWTQNQVPGLEVDLGFRIQAKRLDPGSTLNPRIVRELRGSITSGQWGLLITTARVSPATREDGISDPSRIVSVIDGENLVKLCQKYEVGFKAEYRFDKSFLEPEEMQEKVVATPSYSSHAPSDLSELLKQSLGEDFKRVGNSVIYKSPSKTVIARWSQRYKKSQDYWWGLHAKDLEAIEDYGVTHYAYICGKVGTILIPASIMEKYAEEGRFARTPREGDLQHYHIAFTDRKGKLEWMMREGRREEAQQFFHPISAP
jgi:hypothetical protein